jgi:hypothetical protein
MVFMVHIVALWMEIGCLANRKEVAVFPTSLPVVDTQQKRRC